MAPPTEPPTEPDVAAGPEEEPRYGGFTRFEIELEVPNGPIPPSATRSPLVMPRSPRNHADPPQFVQCLANPLYLNHLAAQKYLSRPEFVAYLAYLRYWARPPYVKYLTYPGPTLRHLELLQGEAFRRDILSPDLVERLFEEGTKASVAWHAPLEG